MKKLEYKDANSAKFWSIHVEGSEVQTHWRRIGTTGQKKTKTYASPEAAQIDADKAIRSGRRFRRAEKH